MRDPLRKLVEEIEDMRDRAADQACVDLLNQVLAKALEALDADIEEAS